jgi:predicted small integral membrane protein
MEFENCNFVKNLRELGLLQEARVSSFCLVNALGIYRARDWSKKNEKRYGFECKNIFLSISIKSFQHLIFSSLYELARNWHVLWASLVLKVDRNPTQLVLHLVFIFYLIYN